MDIIDIRAVFDRDLGSDFIVALNKVDAVYILVVIVIGRIEAYADFLRLPVSVERYVIVPHPVLSEVYGLKMERVVVPSLKVITARSFGVGIFRGVLEFHKV